MSEKTKSQIIRESNIATYSPILSKEDLLVELFKSGNANDKKVAETLRKDNNLAETLTDVLESITVEPVTTRQMLRNLYNADSTELDSKNISSYASNFIKIVHATDYNITDKIKFNDTGFGIKIENEKKNGKYFEYKEKYGVCNFNKLNTVLPSSSFISEKTVNKTVKKLKPNSVYNLDAVCNIQKNIDKPEENILNRVLKTGELVESRSSTSLSFIMIDNPKLRIGTRNSLELSTFFNSLSTIELSKCIPYFNIEFILPRINTTKGGNTYETASITQFLSGTPNKKDNVTSTFRSLSANFVREIDRKNQRVSQEAVRSNMSAFTMPQTVNSFDEKFIGHSENRNLSDDDDFKRQNNIHDYTRPFMTIKNFSVDIAPTQGLMSFKTGRISLVLHDRTRMSEIAPFIKPDLFGSFGAELVVTYGWSHIDGMNKSPDRQNFLGEFLDKSKITEKYIITNSSYNIDNTGQVNIDLTIAMRGPIDIRSQTIKSDSTEKIRKSHVKTYFESYRLIENDLKETTVNDFTIDLSPLVNKVNAEIEKYSSNDKKDENLILISHAGSPTTIGRFNKKLKETKKNKDAKLKDFEETLKILYAVDNSTNSVSNQLIRPTMTFKEDRTRLVTSGDQLAETNPLKRIYITSTSSGFTTPRLKDKLIDLFESLSSYFQICYQTYVEHKLRDDQRKKKIVDSIIGGLGVVDPFFNKEWVKRYYLCKGTPEEQNNASAGKIPLNENYFKGTEYVSFGAFISSLISAYMCAEGKFNEVQIVSYTLNDNAALMKNLNIASLLIPRKKLDDFLTDMFSSGTTMTVEGIITQVINRFIITSTQVCYGFSELYKRENNVVKPRVEESDIHTAKFDNQLQNIYAKLADKDIEDVSSSNVTFSMPRVRLVFDTLVSRKESVENTICRVSIIDQNDNPFKAMSDIMNGVYSNGIIKYSNQINRANREKRKKQKKDINQTATAEVEFQTESYKIIQKLLGYSPNASGKYVRDESLKPLIKELKNSEGNPTGEYEIIDRFNLSLIKNRLKQIMPSVTYGTQNSAIIDASITTVNEAKLNTVYMTRADRNNDNAKQQIAAQVKFKEDMPLRVMPSQANITMFGCPFVNFAQYIFLDFETGTTVDNQYAITGIKHDFSPGKFTTSLTLSYGDVYGKYEAAIDTISKALAAKYDKKLEQVIKKEKEEKKRRLENERLQKENEQRLLGTSGDSGNLIQIDSVTQSIIDDVSDIRTPAAILGAKETAKKFKSASTLTFVKSKYGEKPLIPIAAEIANKIYKEAEKIKSNFKEGEYSEKVFFVTSGYRSIETQQNTWNENFKKYKALIIKEAKSRDIDESDIQNLDAQAALTTWQWVALPGSSEHQKGYTIDFKMHKTLSNKSSNVKKIKESSTYKWFTSENNKYFKYLSPYKNEAWHFAIRLEEQIQYLRDEGKWTEEAENKLRVAFEITEKQLAELGQANLDYKRKIKRALAETQLAMPDKPGVKKFYQNKLGNKVQKFYTPKKSKSKKENNNKKQTIEDITINEIKRLNIDIKEKHIKRSESFKLGSIDNKSYNTNNIKFKSDYKSLNNTGFQFNEIQVNTFILNKNLAFYKIENKTLKLYIGLIRKDQKASLEIDLLDEETPKKLLIDTDKISYPEKYKRLLNILHKDTSVSLLDSEKKYFKLKDLSISENQDNFRNFVKEIKESNLLEELSAIIDNTFINDLADNTTEYDFNEVEEIFNSVGQEFMTAFCTKRWLADADDIEDETFKKLNEPFFDIEFLQSFLRNDKAGFDKKLENRNNFFKSVIKDIFNFNIKVDVTKNKIDLSTNSEKNYISSEVILDLDTKILNKEFLKKINKEKIEIKNAIVADRLFKIISRYKDY